MSDKPGLGTLLDAVLHLNDVVKLGEAGEGGGLEVSTVVGVDALGNDGLAALVEALVEVLVVGEALVRLVPVLARLGRVVDLEAELLGRLEADVNGLSVGEARVLEAVDVGQVSRLGGELETVGVVALVHVATLLLDEAVVLANNRPNEGIGLGHY